MSKKMLSLEEIEGQTALELPERETMLVFVFLTIGDVTVNIPVQNNNVAVQVCAAANLIGALIGQTVTCIIGQNGNGGGHGNNG